VKTKGEGGKGKTLGEKTFPKGKKSALRKLSPLQGKERLKGKGKTMLEGVWKGGEKPKEGEGGKY